MSETKDIVRKALLDFCDKVRAGNLRATQEAFVEADKATEEHVAALTAKLTAAEQRTKELERELGQLKSQFPLTFGSFGSVEIVGSTIDKPPAAELVKAAPESCQSAEPESKGENNGIESTAAMSEESRRQPEISEAASAGSSAQDEPTPATKENVSALRESPVAAAAPLQESGGQFEVQETSTDWCVTRNGSTIVIGQFGSKKRANEYAAFLRSGSSAEVTRLRAEVERLKLSVEGWKHQVHENRDKLIKAIGVDVNFGLDDAVRHIIRILKGTEEAYRKLAESPAPAPKAESGEQAEMRRENTWFRAIMGRIVGLVDGDAGELHSAEQSLMPIIRDAAKFCANSAPATPPADDECEILPDDFSREQDINTGHAPPSAVPAEAGETDYGKALENTILIFVDEQPRLIKVEPLVAADHKRLVGSMKKPKLGLIFMRRLAKEGGAIVSSAACSPEEIAEAQADKRWFVDDDGLGFVLRPSAVPAEGETDLGECDFCGEPATRVEQWDDMVPVCDACSVPGIENAAPPSAVPAEGAVEKVEPEPDLQLITIKRLWEIAADGDQATICETESLAFQVLKARGILTKELRDKLNEILGIRPSPTPPPETGQRKWEVRFNHKTGDYVLVIIDGATQAEAEQACRDVEAVRLMRTHKVDVIFRLSGERCYAKRYIRGLEKFLSRDVDDPATAVLALASQLSDTKGDA